MMMERGQQLIKAIINGVCGCDAGYFDNSYNYPCVACSDMVQFCAQCTFIANLSLLSANCLANIDSGLLVLMVLSHALLVYQAIM